MNQSESQYDVAIIGGGPAGATAGLLLARAGVKTVILEKTTFPRFSIGESFLPRAYKFMCDELGIKAAIDAMPQVKKFGAEFALGSTRDDQTCRFDFDGSLTPGGRTFNVERAVFDDLMLAQARTAGAEVRTDTAVREILQLRDGDVTLRTDAGVINARWLLDASGPATVVGRHLKTRVAADEPHLKKVAYFQHFGGVKRLQGREEGHPLIIMSEEGWFWIIPLNETTTSVGMVLDSAVARRINLPANQMLAWGISRCPLLRGRMGEASGPQTNQVLADFSYRCRPYAGPGYFLLGDAAAFMDPIFSTGVCLGMMSAAQAARHVIAIQSGTLSPAKARQRYVRFVEGSTATFFKLVREYYRHSFRELFLNRTGPLSMHRAVLSILAGHVFPKPAWRLRWRLAAFYRCVQIQEKFALVPRQRKFSLLAEEPVEWTVAPPEQDFVAAPSLV